MDKTLKGFSRPKMKLHFIWKANPLKIYALMKSWMETMVDYLTCIVYDTIFFCLLLFAFHTSFLFVH